jgi:hypothetical protein
MGAPGRIFLWQSMTPYVFAAILAMTLDMHPAIVGGPAAGADSTQRIGRYHTMLAAPPHRFIILIQSITAYSEKFAITIS